MGCAPPVTAARESSSLSRVAWDMPGSFWHIPNHRADLRGLTDCISLVAPRWDFHFSLRSRAPQETLRGSQLSPDLHQRMVPGIQGTLPTSNCTTHLSFPWQGIVAAPARPFLLPHAGPSRRFNGSEQITSQSDSSLPGHPAQGMQMKRETMISQCRALIQQLAFA